MLAQVLHIAHFKSGLLGETEHLGNRNQLSIRKHIHIREGSLRRFGPISPPPNAVIQKNTARLEQVEGSAKVLGQLALAHMLHHSHTDEFVELAELCCFAV